MTIMSKSESKAMSDSVAYSGLLPGLTSDAYHHFVAGCLNGFEKMTWLFKDN